ncbi:MAG: hypothetical protein RLZZ156_1955 [Deinococcota bacterium]|jgi:hypothetical protein
MKPYLKLLNLLVLATFVACGGAPTPNPADLQVTPDKLEYTVLPETMQLSNAVVQKISSVSTVNGNLTFTGNPSELSSLEQGSVLLAPSSPQTPKGLLRIVKSKKLENGNLVLETTVAPIQLAFSSMDIQISRRIDEVGTANTKLLGQFTQTIPFSRELLLDYVPYNADNNLQTKNDQMVVSGGLGVGMVFKFTLSFDWGGKTGIIKEVAKCIATGGLLCDVDKIIPELKTGLEFDTFAKASFGIEGAASLPFDTGEKPICEDNKKTCPPINLGTIPVGPLVFDVGLDFTGQIDGEASSSIKLAAGMEMGVRASVMASTKTGIDFVPPTPYKKFSLPTVSASLKGRARVRVGPRLSVLLYGVIGPTVGAQFTGEVVADASLTPCWKLNLGVSASVGLRLRIPWEKIGFEEIADTLGINLDLSKSKKYDLISQTVLTGTCSAPPIDNIPPGDSPSSQTLLNPTFTPWSKIFNFANPEFEASFEYSYEQGGEWTNLHKTIDGSDVLGSSESPYTLKISPKGSILWTKMFRSEINTQVLGLEKYYYPPNAVVSSLDGNILIASSPKGRIVPSQPTVLIRASQDGQVLSATQYLIHPENQAGYTGTRKMIQLPDGTLYILADANDADNTNVVLLKLNASGTVIWAKTIDIGLDDLPTSLESMSDGGVVVAGYDHKAFPTSSFIIRFGADGSQLWAKKAVGCASGQDSNLGITASNKTGSGDLLFVGTGYYAPTQGVMMQLSPSGVLVQSKIYETGSSIRNVWFTGIQQLATTGFIISAVRERELNQDSLALIGLDSLGGVQWSRSLNIKTLGGESNVVSAKTSLRLTTDGGIMALGSTPVPTPSGNRNGLWISKIPAKNGEIALNSSFDNDPTPVTVSACTIALSNLNPVISSRAVQTKEITVTTEDFSPPTVVTTP